LLKDNIVCVQPKLTAMQKRWLPWSLYEYFLTRLSVLLFDKGCVVLSLTKSEKTSIKQIPHIRW